VQTCGYACVCICVCMYVCIVHVYMYAHVYMYVCVYVCIYIYIRARVGVICTRVGAFCLFVLSNLSTTCACITGVFQHLHACVWGDWKCGLFQLVHG